MMITSLSAGRYAPPAMHGTHDRRDLRNVEFATHQRVIKKDSARAVLTWKDSVLIRQINAGRIYQINDGRAITHSNFLRTQNFRDRLRPPGARLHCCVIGDNDGGAALNAAKSGDHSGGRRLPVIKIVCDQQPDFDEARPRVEQPRNPFARSQFSRAVLLVDPLGSAALPKLIFEVVQRVNQVTHVSLAGDILSVVSRELRSFGHRPFSVAFRPLSRRRRSHDIK